VELRSNGCNCLYKGVRFSDPITNDDDFVRVVATGEDSSSSRVDHRRTLCQRKIAAFVSSHFRQRRDILIANESGLAGKMPYLNDPDEIREESDGYPEHKIACECGETPTAG
jgi:hypothetical protein